MESNTYIIATTQDKEKELFSQSNYILKAFVTSG